MSVTCGGGMAVSPQQIARLDAKFCNGNVSANSIEENDEILDNSNQISSGKPPRSLSTVRHCSSSAFLSEPKKNCENFMEILEAILRKDQNSTWKMSSSVLTIFVNIFLHLQISLLPAAFYGVFDGHGGIDAATFTRSNILKFIVEDSHFPAGIKKAVKNAFAKADHALADAKSLDRSSGTTALTAFMLDRMMLIANAGDSRAVLGKRGRAIELSKDHKPNVTSERIRIEKLGGVIYDGYLNGQLSVARALGDWHIKGSKGSNCPLSSEPELEEIILTEEDEFLILGCDGLWDVMSSQCAVTMVRKALMQHNDPEKCSKALVKEALQRNTCDNLTVVVICFSANPPPKIEIPKYHRRRSISAEGLDHLKGALNSL
ncbi:hypothetical protein Patl1_29287 [Pistacia atlantica]|uniref:Uncharacterized protein n=1 Tax=Pistacia atlantica TaxID=434234 RepID=A0ACC1BDG7_9ROSI|nr:hypothetical protein Patl1_29287 [Pistacia atlantica]